MKLVSCYGCREIYDPGQNRGVSPSERAALERRRMSVCPKCEFVNGDDLGAERAAEARKLAQKERRRVRGRS